MQGKELTLKNLSNRKIKFTIGITVRNAHVAIVRYDVHLRTVDTVHHHAFDNSRNTYDNIVQAIEAVGNDFFDHASVNFSIPTRDIDTQKALVPTMEADMLDQAIANMVTGAGIIWDYKIFETIEKDGAWFYDIGIFKVPEQVIQQYMIMFETLDITLSSITCEPATLSSVLADSLTKPISYPFLIADLSAKSMVLYIVVDNKPKYVRMIPIGFQDFVTAINRQITIDSQPIDISEEQAIKFLNNPQLLTPPHHDPRLERLYFLLRPVLEKVSIECEKTISFFRRQSHDIPIDHIYLLGNFSRIASIEEYMKTQVKFHVDTFDFTETFTPFLKQFPKLKPELLAWGLAASNTDPKENHFTLIPNTILRNRKSQIAMMYAGIAIGVFLFLFVCITGWLSYSNNALSDTYAVKQTELADYRAAHPELDIGNSDPGTEDPFFEAIAKANKEKMNIPETLLSISRLIPDTLTVTKIQMINNDLALEGYVLRQTAQQDVIDFVQQLNRLPYLKNVIFEVMSGEGSSDSKFSINGSYTEHKEVSL